MKLKLTFTIALGILIGWMPATAQNQALHFDGVKAHAKMDVASILPAGNTTRTVEFWFRSDRRKGAFENHESILELGQQEYNGSAFGFFTEWIGDKQQLCFWGHNADRRPIAEIPDDQWHFVAVTYEEPYLRCYFDGQFVSSSEIVTAVGGQRLNTKAGPLYVGGFPRRNWYFQGAVDNIRVWSGRRTCEQILMDMTKWPCDITDPKLLLQIEFQEGTGTTFKDKKNRYTGNLLNSATWTKDIGLTPTMIDEGIWFVIQNKSDVDTDLFPAMPRRMAIQGKDDGTLAFAAIPDTYVPEKYADFLWRVEDVAGKKVLVNKKWGATNALTMSGGSMTRSAKNGAAAQQWQFGLSDKLKFGTNVYRISNPATSGANVLALSGSSITKTTSSAATSQAWVIQPMGLVAGYHIGSSDPKCTYMKQLNPQALFQLTGTNTASDWAVLNAYNVYQNVLNAFKDQTRMQRPTYPQATAHPIRLISRYDAMPCEFLEWADCTWINDTRGSGGAVPSARNPVGSPVIITEEMMCRTGTYTRGPKDKDYREYEQVVHEFGHYINYLLLADLDLDNTRYAQATHAPGEWFPWMVQAWFNNKGPRRTIAADQKTYLGQNVFNPDNTWLPPRKLRQMTVPQPKPYRWITVGTTLSVNEKIYSQCEGFYYMQLESDGNLVVRKTADNSLVWDSKSKLSSPASGVIQVKYEQPRGGPKVQLQFVGAGGAILKAIDLHNPTGGCRMVVNNDAANASPIQCFNVNKVTVLWSAPR